MDLKKILDLFSPKFCLFCQKEGVYLCDDCFQKVEIFSSPFCPYCQKRNPQGKICFSCKKFLDYFLSATDYKKVEKIIKEYKYHLIKELSEPLAYLLLKFLKNNSQIEFLKNPQDFLITYIPSSNYKKRKRGFDPAEEIAKILAKTLKIDFLKILEKKKATQDQVKLSFEERKTNVKDAFRTNFFSFKNKKIILIDDVATTLSTLEEGAKILKKAGAQKIYGMSVAKEIR